MATIFLEDDSALLQESGFALLLETGAVVAGAGYAILLESGSELLQEDGASAILLETVVSVVIVPSGQNFVDPDEVMLITI